MNVQHHKIVWILVIVFAIVATYFCTITFQGPTTDHVNQDTKLQGNAGSVKPAKIIRKRKFHGPPIRLVDAPDKKMLFYSAKGGATVAVQTFFRTLNIYDMAIRYSKWIHDFEWQIFHSLPYFNYKHYPCALCSQEDWHCAKVVRDPLDRTVSSYIHTLKMNVWTNINYYDAFSGNESNFFENRNSSFYNYLNMLEYVENANMHVKFSEHYMPQTTSCDSDYVALILIEEAEESFEAYYKFSGVNYTYVSEHSPHYINNKKNIARDPNLTAYTPFEKLRDNLPLYESFYRDTDVFMKVYDIFYDDFKLYERACNQKWLLEGCSSCQARCDNHRSRLHTYLGTFQY